MRRRCAAAPLAVALNLLALASSLAWVATSPLRADGSGALASTAAVPSDGARPESLLRQAPCPGQGAAALAPAGDTGVAVNVNTIPAPAGTEIDATIINLQPGQAPLLVVATTVGPEQVTGPPVAGVPPGAPIPLSGTVRGIPVPGAAVTLSVQGPPGAPPQVLAQGALRCQETPAVPAAPQGPPGAPPGPPGPPQG